MFGIPADTFTALAVSVVAALGLPATYLGLRRTSNRRIDKTTATAADGLYEAQQSMIADLRTELDTQRQADKADCDQRIDRLRRESDVRLQRAARLLTEATTYASSLERRILDMTVGGRSEDLLAELDEHAKKLQEAKRELGVIDLPG